jgi:pimeloyl-ACP methyl ester carboxylesterase
MKPLIHFAHGNGFPSLCYRQMLSYLEPHFDCCIIDKIGHDPLFPVTENWQHLVDEIIHSVKTQANQPVIAVGHSLGGVLSLLAATQEPSLFQAVIMLDSPVIGRFKSRLLKLAKILGLIDKITPAQRTRGRRRHWNNYEQLMGYLLSKELFKHFTEACLNDYINYGLEYKEDGYYLRFNPKIEYEIYRTIPHVLPQFEGQFKLPGALIYGDKSNVVDRMDIRYMKKYFHIESNKTRGSHLFPMEYPKEAAQQIIKTVEGLLGSVYISQA